MDGQLSFEFEQRKPIKGYPELHWTGKRPYTSTQYYPAQLKESFGEPKNGWMNKIFWGDNLQVMSHLLKEFRGKIDLIYIDPPFDSKADYKKKIKVKGKEIIGDSLAFEEKQYGDIWTKDEYLQYMYERLILIKELLSPNGSLYVHLDEKRSHYMKVIIDEVFGPDCFKRELVWSTKTSSGFKAAANNWVRTHDTIFYYSKGNEFNKQYWEYGDEYKARFKKKDEDGRLYRDDRGSGIKQYLDELKGIPMGDVWDDIMSFQQAATSAEIVGYPTQKPEALVERVVKASSKEGDIVFDCFMGSGTTQAVAMKLGRRFIGADINLGAIQTTTKRLLSVSDELRENERECYTGVEIYNVNNYDFFRNPLEAKELIIDALGIQRYDSSSAYDGELDGWMVKIMPTNRIATKADLEELKANLPYRTFEKRREENPNGVVEKIRIICMGHEADLKASLEQELSAYKLEIEILDILRDKTELQFKREADANVVKEGNMVVVKEFYPMNLLQKLSMQKESVEDWRQLVESIYIDWNYDGETMRPTVCDIPDKDDLVSGVYEIPASATRIKIKITDLLSESLELEV